MACGSLKPSPTGWWERIVVVSAVRRMLNYLQILFSFPSSTLSAWVSYFNFTALTVFGGISKCSIECAEHSEI